MHFCNKWHTSCLATEHTISEFPMMKINGSPEKTNQKCRGRAQGTCLPGLKLPALAIGQWWRGTWEATFPPAWHCQAAPLALLMGFPAKSLNTHATNTPAKPLAHMQGDGCCHIYLTKLGWGACWKTFGPMLGCWPLRGSSSYA